MLRPPAPLLPALALLAVPTLWGCVSGGTERIRDPATGTETIRMKNNGMETPGAYRLAFNLAVVREGRESGYSVYLTYHGAEPIQVPFASGIELRIGEETWKLRGMVRREISGVVGCTLGVPCSYVTHVVAPLDRSLVERILAAERFTVIIDARRARLRGTGGSEAVARIRAFLRETAGDRWAVP